MKIRPLGSRLLHANRQPRRSCKVGYRKFANAPQNFESGKTFNKDYGKKLKVYKNNWWWNSGLPVSIKIIIPSLERKNPVPNTKKDRMLKHVLYQRKLPLHIRSSRSVKQTLCIQYVHSWSIYDIVFVGPVCGICIIKMSDIIQQLRGINFRPIRVLE
jgi:hypothetical protein